MNMNQPTAGDYAWAAANSANSRIDYIERKVDYLEKVATSPMKLTHTGTAPTKGRREDAAYDLRAEQQYELLPGERKLIRTGFNVSIPVGYVGLVCPRSGLALNWGVTVLNAPGVVDPGYIGDVSVILINHGEHPFAVNKGDRVAQLLFVRTQPTVFLEVDAIVSQGLRGAEGFGSSGVA